MIELIDNQYLGNVYYYKILFQFTHIKLEQYQNHQRAGFANRCCIGGANGLIVLSIPLLNGRNQKTIINEVQIDNREKWQSRHWKSLESSYHKSPWFEYYRNDLKHFYSTEYHFLYQWNKDLLLYILQMLDWEGEVSETTIYQEKYPSDIYNDSRNRITTKNYQHFSPVKYTQVFEERHGFLPNLSILDLLFCWGKTSKLLL